MTASTPFANVMPAGSLQEAGDAARLSSFVGAIAIGDLVKSTLGPKGLDKIIVPVADVEREDHHDRSGDRKRAGDFKITNDGATILQSLQVDNPAAKVLVALSRTQDDAVGDGTTTVTVLAAELLRQAERLTEHHRMHPQLVIAGYRLACQQALRALTAFSDSRPRAWTAAGPEGDKGAAARMAARTALNRDLLLQMAKTTLSSKVLAAHHEHFAQIAVDAIERLARNPAGIVDIALIEYVKRKGGGLAESYFVADGFLLPKTAGIGFGGDVADARVLVANTPMDADKIKVFGAKIAASSPGQLKELERAEREKMRQKVQRIVQSGCNVFVNRQLVYNWPEQLLHDARVLCVEHADFEGVNRAAAALGARIKGTFDGDDDRAAADRDRPEEYLGRCRSVRQVDVFGATMTLFEGLPETGHAGTIVLRGATDVLLDEAERSLHDVLRVLSSLFLKDDARTVLGAGHAEFLMAASVDALLHRAPIAVDGHGEPCASDDDSPAGRTLHKGGKIALAVAAFAEALRALPTALADNAGLDSTDVISRLRLAHSAHAGDASCCTMGLFIPTQLTSASASRGLTAGQMQSNICDVAELGIVESYQLKRQILLAASEAAEMLLRVDYIFKDAPKPRQADRCH